MNRFFFFCIGASLAFMACSSGDGDEPGMPPVERPLTVVVNETPFANEYGDAQAPRRMDTRGSAVTTEGLTEFTMSYNNNIYRFSKSGTTWTSTDLNSWPNVDNDTPVSFYAYNAGTYYYNSGANYLSFEAMENASTLTDLLVAKQEGITYNDTKGQVSLTFDHACAAVDFTISITPKLVEKLGGGNLTVNKVVLEQVAKQGDYYFSGGWKNVNTTTNYTLTSAESMAVGTDEQTLPCGTLFLIPQTLGSRAQFAITYTLAGETKTTQINLDRESWQAGYQYTMHIGLGTANIQVSN